jgi:hypothetical protein
VSHNRFVRQLHDASIRAIDDDEHDDEGGNDLLQVSNLPYFQMSSDDVTTSKAFPSHNETTKASTNTDNHNYYCYCNNNNRQAVNVVTQMQELTASVHAFVVVIITDIPCPRTNLDRRFGSGHELRRHYRLVHDSMLTVTIDKKIQVHVVVQPASSSKAGKIKH